MATIVFADLCGSTGMFENLGNERATKAVTKLTDWMSQVARSLRGRTVKTLGDGVLLHFHSAEDALEACIAMQRQHAARIAKWPPVLRAQIQTGVATGEVVLLDGDCFGDAVNVAARLAGMSGAAQVWVDGASIEALPSGHAVRYRSLGELMIRGKAEPQALYQLDWAEVPHSSILTVQAGLSTGSLHGQSISTTPRVTLTWLDIRATFEQSAGAVVIGRDSDCGFRINDTHVSRQHCKIAWQNTPSGGHWVLVDTSSFGTWVRFVGREQAIEIRRDRCTLSTDAEIALGAPFTDFAVPTVLLNLA